MFADLATTTKFCPKKLNRKQLNDEAFGDPFQKVQGQTSIPKGSECVMQFTIYMISSLVLKQLILSNTFNL